MPSYQPNPSFCSAANLPYPAPASQWSPDHFTMESLETLLTTALQGTTPVPAQHFFHAFSAFNPLAAFPTLSIHVPVMYSPTQALAVAERIDSAKQIVKTRRSLTTFFFDIASPTFEIDDKQTAAAMAELTRKNKVVALLIRITPDMSITALEPRITNGIRTVLSSTKRTLANVRLINDGCTDAELASAQNMLEPYFKNMNIEPVTKRALLKCHSLVISSRGGVFNVADPLATLADNASNKPVVLELPEWSFAQEPLWPAQRIEALPEVNMRSIENLRAHLAHAGRGQLLGLDGTTEAVPETLVHAGTRGFRTIRHEMS